MFISVFIYQITINHYIGLIGRGLFDLMIWYKAIN